MADTIETKQPATAQTTGGVLGEKRHSVGRWTSAMLSVLDMELMLFVGIECDG